MNKRERRRIASAFRACVPYLAKSGCKGAINEFICEALMLSRHPAAAIAKDIVDDRIWGEISVRGWLRRKKLITGKEYWSIDIQPYRHLWVQSLIKEFSK